MISSEKKNNVYLQYFIPQFRSYMPKTYIDLIHNVKTQDPSVLYLEESVLDKFRKDQTLFKNVFLDCMHDAMYEYVHMKILNVCDKTDSLNDQLCDKAYEACIKLIEILKNEMESVKNLSKEEVLKEFRTYFYDQFSRRIDYASTEYRDLLDKFFLEQYEDSMEKSIDEIVFAHSNEIYIIMTTQIYLFLEFFKDHPIPEVWFYLNFYGLSDIGAHTFSAKDVLAY